MQKSSGKTVFTILVLYSFFMGAFPSNTLAAGGAPPVPGKTVNVGLSVDCSKLPSSKEGLKVLADHHLCGLGQGVNSATDSVSSNCGTLTLTLANNHAGVLGVSVTVTSAWYIGPLYKFFYAGDWTNESTHSNGATGAIVTGASYTLNSYEPYYTDTGHVVSLVLTAEAQSVTLINCTNASSLTADTQVTI